MKRFAQLFRELDETNRTSVRTAAIVRYLQAASAEDIGWAIHFLCGRRPRRTVTLTQLRQWCAETSGLPEWLVAECYDRVGDLAETISLLLPPPAASSDLMLHVWVEQRLLPLRQMSDEDAAVAIRQAWEELDQRQRFVFNKLLTGGLRVGISRNMVVRALAEFSGLEAAVIAHRLMGQWQPSADFITQLLSPNTSDADISRPYPFCLANPLGSHDDAIQPLWQQSGNLADWLIEWKWDGIRMQLIRRSGRTFLWSRGEDLLTERFPELTAAAAELPDGTVLDGEVIPWQAGQLAAFTSLQKRLGRKTVSRRLLREVPVRFLAFDLLEEAGQDIRSSPLSVRRQRLQQLVQDMKGADQSAFSQSQTRWKARMLFVDFDSEALASEAVKDHIADDGTGRAIQLSPVVPAADWAECVHHRAESRLHGVEGLMIKRQDGPYTVGRTAGIWWKWKIQPYTCDAVLVYAQRGHGRRAGMYTDYTFAAWQDDQLVPFARAYSGLSDSEMRQIDRFVQQNTIGRFGPVRQVRPQLVVELAFEAIQSSARNKSGIALRFPRILRLRLDRKPEDADSIQSIRALMDPNNC